MNDVKLSLNEKGEGAFFIMDGPDVIGEMIINISGNDLTVFHTEAAEKAEGQGLAKKLLASMVHHARTNNLKVIPLCPYVHAQFKRHQEEYQDVWKREPLNHQ